MRCWRPQFNSWVGKVPWRRGRLPTPGFLAFSGGSDSEEPMCNAGDLGLTLGLGRSPGGGHGNPLQYSWLENPLGQRSLAGYSPWHSPGTNTGMGYPLLRGSSQPKDQTCDLYDLCVGSWFFTTVATWEAQRDPVVVQLLHRV